MFFIKMFSCEIKNACFEEHLQTASSGDLNTLGFSRTQEIQLIQKQALLHFYSFKITS